MAIEMRRTMMVRDFAVHDTCQRNPGVEDEASSRGPVAAGYGAFVCIAF